MSTGPQTWGARRPTLASNQTIEDPEATAEDPYTNISGSRAVPFRGSPNPQSITPFPEEIQQQFVNEIPLMSLSQEAFGTDAQSVLSESINPAEVEIKPDGVCYLPEIRYRKTLLRAFGPGGWCLVPRGPHTQNANVLSREYALICHGRYVSQARGSTTIASFSNAALASEAVRSNALMRCCKDLGIASELWDGKFIESWKEKYAQKRTVTDSNGRTKYLWSKK